MSVDPMPAGHGETDRVCCTHPDPATLALQGALTFATAAQALREGARALNRCTRLDLSGIVRADSAALATVLALLAQASRAGQRLTVVDPPGGMLALAEVCGARDLLEPAAATASA